jgi:hypothetical protein
MKAGTTARLIQPEIKGQIKERRFTPSDELEYLLEWTEADGNTVARWFAAAQLEEVKNAE